VIFKGKNPKTTVSYYTQYNAVRILFKVLNFATSIATHMGRKAAGENPHFQLLPEATKDDAGRWQQNSRQAVYAPALPLTAMLSLAALDEDPKRYFLKRNALQPPETLIEKAFPTKNSLEELQSSRETDIAAVSFLKAMKRLGSSFLQDCVCLRQLVGKGSFLCLTLTLY
jgi:hypothetical protein